MYLKVMTIEIKPKIESTQAKTAKPIAPPTALMICEFLINTPTPIEVLITIMMALNKDSLWFFFIVVIVVF
jgi:hypothetical protein